MSNPTTAPAPPTGADTARAPGLIIFGYAAGVYLFFLAVLAYAVGFFAGVGVPRSIDRGPHTSVAAAVCVDLLLLLLFAAQHSIMARERFKRLWTRVVPPAAERATYVLATSLVLTLLFWLWRPIDAKVWHAPTPLAFVLGTGYLLGWALAVGSTYLISHVDLFGLRQAWVRLRRAEYRPPAFQERSLYRHIRHPLMAGFLVVFWSAPTMTAGHLLFAVVATGYIAVGIAFEERDLVRSFGVGYTDYRARVPALIPWPGRRSS